ncbi:MAG: hypothetical protein IJQ65_06575, partial [Kiritimatiellae bacterium]|nr:hypothetical protein [Kiritimatiellia bacterium]
RRGRRMVHDDVARWRRRRVMHHYRRRTMMVLRDGLRRAVMRIAWRGRMVASAVVHRRLLLHMRLCGRPPADVSSTRSGEDGPADRNARKTRNHELLDVLVHIAPL